MHPGGRGGSRVARVERTTKTETTLRDGDCDQRNTSPARWEGRWEEGSVYSNHCRGTFGCYRPPTRPKSKLERPRPLGRDSYDPPKDHPNLRPALFAPSTTGPTPPRSHKELPQSTPYILNVAHHRSDVDERLPGEHRKVRLPFGWGRECATHVRHPGSQDSFGGTKTGVSSRGAPERLEGPLLPPAVQLPVGVHGGNEGGGLLYGARTLVLLSPPPEVDGHVPPLFRAGPPGSCHPDLEHPGQTRYTHSVEVRNVNLPEG